MRGGLADLQLVQLIFPKIEEDDIFVNCFSLTYMITLKKFIVSYVFAVQHFEVKDFEK